MHCPTCLRARDERGSRLRDIKGCRELLHISQTSYLMQSQCEHVSSRGLAAQDRLLSGARCTTSTARNTASNTNGLPQRSCSGSFSRRATLVQHVRHTRSDSLVARMGIKWIENFESKVEISEERKSELEGLLENHTFCKQVQALIGDSCLSCSSFSFQVRLPGIFGSSLDNAWKPYIFYLPILHCDEAKHHATFVYRLQLRLSKTAAQIWNTLECYFSPCLGVLPQQRECQQNLSSTIMILIM